MIRPGSPGAGSQHHPPALRIGDEPADIVIIEALPDPLDGLRHQTVRIQDGGRDAADLRRRLQQAGPASGFLEELLALEGQGRAVSQGGGQPDLLPGEPALPPAVPDLHVPVILLADQQRDQQHRPTTILGQDLRLQGASRLQLAPPEHHRLPRPPHLSVERIVLVTIIGAHIRDALLRRGLRGIELAHDEEALSIGGLQDHIRAGCAQTEGEGPTDPGQQLHRPGGLREGGGDFVEQGLLPQPLLQQLEETTVLEHHRRRVGEGLQPANRSPVELQGPLDPLGDQPAPEDIAGPEGEEGDGTHAMPEVERTAGLVQPRIGGHIGDEDGLPGELPGDDRQLGGRIASGLCEKPPLPIPDQPGLEDSFLPLSFRILHNGQHIPIRPLDRKVGQQGPGRPLDGRRGCQIPGGLIQRLGLLQGRLGLLIEPGVLNGHRQLVRQDLQHREGPGGRTLPPACSEHPGPR
jgi:hypothetical protein